MPSWTIVMFPKIQVDTSIAYFLLKHFGEEKFPGIGKSKLEFWTELPAGRTTPDLESDGYILIDLGLSKFDHHRLGPENRRISSSHLVAEYLGIEDRQDLQRLLEFARRDDLEGRGTLSADPIDRAFGLSGLLTNLNKSIPNDSARVLAIVEPLLIGHYLEENRRYEQLPAEYQQLVAAGKIKEFGAIQLGRNLKVVYVESDNPALAGYIRSKAVGADLVIQRASTGHVNFISKQQARLILKKLARLVKLLEAQKAGIVLNVDSQEDLELSGRTDGLPHWYYDTRANTLQNGGVNPQATPASSLTYEELETVTKQGLNIDRASAERRPLRRMGFGAERDHRRDDRGSFRPGDRGGIRRDDRHGRDPRSGNGRGPLDRGFGNRGAGQDRGGRFDRNRGVVEL